MALDTLRKRENAMLMGGSITPDGLIAEEDWAYLLEQFSSFIGLTAIFSINLYVERARTVLTGADSEADGMKIERTRAFNSYVEKTKSLNLGLL